MQVICTDGTIFSCEGYELTEYGVVIYDQEHDSDEERDRYGGDPEQVGYVPHDRLWYVLPDGVTPNVSGVRGVQSRQPQGAGQPGSPQAGQAGQSANQGVQPANQGGQPTNRTGQPSPGRGTNAGRGTPPGRETRR
ncbi:hypothetical protein [Halomicrobium salinisoli]|uniref:hypothetical protein n=1 Tax=Halomicrobium salinisoli TaxID=2878391 RepID=UPI001CEFE945|nr:hypothetical protein [Halomicrobium salinisoli]